MTLTARDVLSLGDGCAPLRHALAFAKAIHRHCVVNRISCHKVADALGLDLDQVIAARAFLAQCPVPPPPEVCAGVASLDPGLDDSDIAEMFSRSERWAKMARERREEFCAELGIKPTLSPWVVEGDPTPQEIQEYFGQPGSRRLSAKTLF